MKRFLLLILVLSLSLSLAFTPVYATVLLTEDSVETLNAEESSEAPSIIDSAEGSDIILDEKSDIILNENPALSPEDDTEYSSEDEPAVFPGDEEMILMSIDEVADPALEEATLSSIAEEVADTIPVGAAPSGNVGEHYPYSYHNAAQQTENITVSGSTFKDAIVFTMGYNGLSSGYTGTVDYNFKGKYSSMSFQAGFYSGASRDAKFTVIADGVTVINEETLSCESVPKSYTINLSGVSHLTIQMVSDGYDKARYAIGNVLLASSGVTSQEEPLRSSNMFYSCEPYYLKNASTVSEKFEMGGYTYQDGINMQMGYTGYSDGGTSTVSFNFDKHYQSLSFEIAKYGASAYYVRNATITITADGTVLYDKAPLIWNDIPRKFSINLTGVTELKIQTNSDGYDKVHYRLGNIRMVSDGKVRGIVFKKSSVTLTSDAPEAQLEPVVIPNDAKNQNYTLSIDHPLTADLDDKDIVFGRYKGTATVTATTQEGNYTAACTINSKLPASKYLPSKDGWGFGNVTVNIFPNLSEDNLDFTVSEYYGEVYKRVADSYWLHALTDNAVLSHKYPSGSKAFYSLIGGWTATNGICAGYALSSALTYTKDLPFSMWSQWGGSKPSVPADVESLSETTGYSSRLGLYLKQMLYACYLAQFDASSIASKWMHINDYQDIINAAKHFQSTGKDPILISLHTKRNDKDYGHSVLPYQVVEREKEIYVYIYDCNEVGSDADFQKIVFEKNSFGEIIGWEYDMWKSSDKHAWISYNDSLSTYADRLKNYNTLSFVNNLILSSSSSFTASRGSHSLIKSVNGSFQGDNGQTDLVPFFPTSAAAPYTNDYTALAVLTDGEITMLNTGGEAAVHTVLTTKDSAVHIDSDGNSRITRTEKNNTQLLDVTPSKTGTVTIRYNYGENDCIQITGTADRTVHTTIASDSAQVTAKGFSTIQVSTIRNGKETTVKSTNVLPNEPYTITKEGNVSGTFPQPDIKVRTISITGISKQIAVGKKIQLTASISPSNASNQKVIWTSSNKKVATVNQKGVVKIKKKAGSASVTITATAADGSGVKATYRIKSMKGVVKSVKIQSPKTVKAGSAVKLTAKVTASSGANKKLLWSVDKPKYASVTKSGKLKTKKAGKGKTIKITAAATDGSKKKASCKIKLK